MDAIESILDGFVQSRTPRTSGTYFKPVRPFTEHDIAQAKIDARLAMTAWLAADPERVRDPSNVEAFHQARIFAGSAALARHILTDPKEALPGSYSITRGTSEAEFQGRAARGRRP